ncbi:hypothetical protein [Haliscomenobacter hydrossis]|uniref:Uncharacterized protein n=1 Tax=Haliscomenobacter hydrossis (strain ATCC 27775 / DSM 1100 / LMG 10767 / O) TaxID=760192 RepID=F4KZ73_HALH1|nr:hypothetical protein [Haliscomenobacter hydrossis]AEE53727.1 hypothetical protein Halhy_5904 [Haliscomenobacter hydrossis DSM 1100]
MPTLVDPVVITGRLSGAYRDEPGFQVEGQGIVGLTDIINYLLDGGGEGDGNGIYGGSGNVPANTIATTLGSFKIRSEGFELLLGDDQGAAQSFLNKLVNGTWGFRVADSGDGLETDVQVYKSGFFVETDSSLAAGVTQITTSKDEIQLSANNETGNIVIVRINPKTVRLTGIPEYADDAAADADVLLLADSVYTTTGNRSLKIKP